MGVIGRWTRAARVPPLPAAPAGGLPAPGEARWEPPDLVAEAILRESLSVSRYPDPTAAALRRALGERLQMDPDHIVCGPGSAELIQHIIEGLGGPGREVVVPHPSFPLYLQAIRTAGARAVPVPLAADGGMDLAGLAAAVTSRTSLVVLCNPNNPTGTALEGDRIRAFLEALPPDVTVLLDEAYWEWTDGYGRDPAGVLAWAARYPQLIVTRTFSKYYALAGLRIGYAVAAEPVVAHLIRAHLHHALISRVAQAAARAALQAEDHYARQAVVVRQERSRLAEGLRRLGLQAFPSQTDFVTVAWPGSGGDFRQEDLPPVQDLGTAGLPGFVRFSVGQPEANSRLLARAEAALGRYKVLALR
ncbi:MAG: aminotransferase class I/II-fold pyridoxal phosphate-dependent enzyme [Firmicutes bacterium]|nr:aminotransferase class I/II-fold pyridoxal phosphate-dependent enzyme [Bacillota bacterium]